jgi:CheY-like chemotaxis protein
MDLAGVRVLLVDDDEATRYWIGRLLEQLGAKVASASSARDALQALDAAVPDVLLCDIAMPEEDGYELIRLVRARDQAAGGKVPAVALTAYAVVPRMIERSLRSGFQAHLSKPMDGADLVRVVREAMDNRQGLEADETEA